MTAKTLAVAMIVKDEAAVIERCLASALKVTDKVLVLDTGSTDETVALARKMGAVVKTFKWKDDFSAARNASFMAAKQEFDPDYLMWLDADDVIEDSEAAKIRALMETATADTYVSIYVYASDPHGNPVTIVPRERIVKASMPVAWTGIVHETLPMAGVVENTDIKIHHRRPVERSPSARNVRLYESWIKKNKLSAMSARDMYYYGNELSNVGQHDKATSMLEAFVVKPGAWWEDKANAFLLLANLHKAAGRMEAARRAAADASAIKHSFAEAYCMLGELCVAEKQWKAAIHWYEIAAGLERPADTLGTTQNQYYTWIPHIQLCLCYAESGDFTKAREHNELAAKYLPNHPSIIHNRNVIGKGRNGNGKRLNLGCGGKRMDGYVNCDLYQIPGVDEAFSLDDIPYADGTIGAIHSEHALEHLPRARSHAALREWARVLAPGGELLLKVPDLVGCCEGFVTKPHHRWWYDWTIYGKQEGLSGEPDAGQFHQCGYTQELLNKLLVEAGFIVDYNVLYDGYDTPSIAVRAVRKRASWTLGWLVHENWDEAGTRIRALNVNRWLRARGYDSRLVTPEDLRTNPRAFSFVVTGKRWDTEALAAIDAYKAAGGRVILDVNEDYPSMEAWKASFNYSVALSDVVVACSRKLAEKIEATTGHKTSVIPDGVESPFELNCEYTDKPRLSAVWNGYGGNAELAERLRPLLDECGYDLVTIHEHDNANVKWNRETWAQEMARHDIVLCPQREHQDCKSANKLTTAMALGLPVVANPLPAYKDVVGDGAYVSFATTDEEWKRAFMNLRAVGARRRDGTEGKMAVTPYLADAICEDWLSTIQALVDGDKPVVDIIVPTYNNPDLLEACMRSVKDNTKIKYTVTVVDVGQTKNADHEALKQSMVGGSCVSYQLIKPETKTSFSASNNLAIRATSSPYVMLLNDDTIVTPGWLESLKSAIDDGGYGIAGPFSNCDQGWLHQEQIVVDGLSLHPNMTLAQVDGKVPAIYEYGRARSSGPAHRKDQPWFAFYAVLMPRKVIDDVGLLDETFINGGEDVDFCKRAQKFGYRSVQCLNNFILHFGGKSRKVSQEQDPDAHLREDNFNNRWLQTKYSKPTVVIYTGPAYERWSPRSLVEGGIGGSETAVIHMANELTTLGHRVVVFNDCGDQAGDYGGVVYKHFTEFPAYVDMNWIDVFVSSRDIDVFRLPIRAGKKLCWVHDIWLSPNNELPAHASKVDKFLCLSTWHKGFFADHHRIDPSRVAITRNGIDLKRFKRHDKLMERDPYRFIYSSSPDRGLDVLLEWWPEIRKVQPKANLRVFYGFDNWNKSLARSGDANQIAFRDRIVELLKQPGITVVGRVDQQRLANEMMEARFWAYTAEFWETFCCHPDTMVSVPGNHRGGKPPRVRIADLEGKTNVPVYTFDEKEKRFKIGTMTKCWKTKTANELIHITLDDGEALKLTPEHLVLTYDEDWVEAGGLKPGDRLSSLHFRYDVSIVDRDGRWPRESRLVGEWLEGHPLTPKDHVDHDDPFRLDNSPERLHVMTASAHGRKTHTGRSVRRKQAQAMSERTKARFQRRTAAEATAFGTAGVRAMWDKVNAMQPEERSAFLKRRADAKKASLARKKDDLGGKNHIVVAVERVIGPVDVYDMEVKDTHTFVADGVVVHNCITALEAQAAGMNIVTSGLCGLLDTVEDKSCLVPVPDPWTSKAYVHGPEYKREFLAKLLPLLKTTESPEPVTRDFSWAAVAKTWTSEFFKGSES